MLSFAVSLLQTRQAMEAYRDHAHSLHPHNPSSHSLPPSDITVLVVDMYQRVEDLLNMQGDGIYPHSAVARGQGAGLGSKFYINAAVELTACFIRNIFDG